jgi:serine protease Do
MDNNFENGPNRPRNNENDTNKGWGDFYNTSNRSQNTTSSSSSSQVGGDSSSEYHYTYPRRTIQDNPFEREETIKRRRDTSGNKAVVGILLSILVVMSLAIGVYGLYIVSGKGNTSNPKSSSIKSDQQGGVSNPPQIDIVDRKEGEEGKPARAIYEENSAAIVKLVTTAQNSGFMESAGEAQVGSGCIVSEDGYIITNDHVVRNAHTGERNCVTVYVKIGEDVKEYEGKIIGNDLVTDIAVVKIEAKGLTHVTVGNSDDVKVGDKLFSISNPLGEQGLVQSMAQGICSGKNRSVFRNTDSIQTDAATYPGCSGGGIFDATGKLVAVINSGVTGKESIGFGVSSNTAFSTFKSLCETGYVKGRPSLGIDPYEIGAIDSARLGIPLGVGVKRINSWSKLNEAGVKKGDVIIGVDGKEVKTKDELYLILKEHKPGDVVNIKVYRIGQTSVFGGRSGQTLDLQVTLVEDRGSSSERQEDSKQQEGQKS